MNIIDEIIESYTYNGVVSEKAIEDDIATLENQIESYGFTLNEVRLRRKNDGPLVTKIRDAKIRLSLLKAVEKKVKEQMSSDAAIVNMLGISGKSAKEVEEIGTVANGKAPVPQNFESSEAEKPQPEEEIQVNEDNHGPTVDIDLDGGEVIVTPGSDSGVEYIVPKRETEKENTEVGIVVKPDDRPIEEVTAPTENLVHDPQFQDSGDVMFGNPQDYMEQEEEVPVNKSEPDTEQVLEDVKAEEGPIDEKELEAEYATEQENEAVFRPDTKIEVLENEEERKINVLAPESDTEDKAAETVQLPQYSVPLRRWYVPSITIDDYMEPVDTVEPEASIDENTGEIVLNVDSSDSDVEYQNPCLDCDVTECIKHPESGILKLENVQEADAGDVILGDDKEFFDEAPPLTLDDYQEPLTDAQTFEFDDFLDSNQDLDTVYDAFGGDKCSIGASVDLFNLTNLVNTMHIEPTIDFKKKQVYLHFTDIRDYSVFLELVRLHSKNRWWKRLFEKNLPSIFITAAAETGEYASKYMFAFNNCRVSDVSDSEFRPLDDPESFHDCYAIISYSKVTTLHGTTNKTKDCKETEDRHEEGNAQGISEEDAPEVRNV